MFLGTSTSRFDIHNNSIGNECNVDFSDNTNLPEYEKEKPFLSSIKLA